MHNGLLVAILVLLIVAICIVVILIVNKSRRKISVGPTSEVNNSSVDSALTCNAGNSSLDISEIPDSLKIQVGPVRRQSVNTSKLVEIKDTAIVGRVGAIVPAVGNILQNTQQTGAIVSAGKEIKKAKELLKDSNLYRVIIPAQAKKAGAKLVDSRNLEGAKRAMYRIQKPLDTLKGKKTPQYRGQADLVKIKPSEIESIEEIPKKFLESGAVNSVMNVASAVVGQYYMAQVNNKLETIGDDVKKIEDFQITEFKSKVLNLIEQIQSIAKFNDEIIINEDLRKRKLDSLENRENECGQLLAQANMLINNIIEQKKIQKYDDYMSAVQDIQVWAEMHSVLAKLQEQIAEIKFTLNKGEVSREQCFDHVLNYSVQNAEVEEKLLNWHILNCEHFEIDTDDQYRRRKGWENLGIIAGRRTALSENDKMLIEGQSSVSSTINCNKVDLFNSDVELICDGEKLYYLPYESEKEYDTVNNSSKPEATVMGYIFIGENCEAAASEFENTYKKIQGKKDKLGYDIARKHNCGLKSDSFVSFRHGLIYGVKSEEAKQCFNNQWDWAKKQVEGLEEKERIKTLKKYAAEIKTTMETEFAVSVKIFFDFYY